MKFAPEFLDEIRARLRSFEAGDNVRWTLWEETWKRDA